MPSDYVCKNCNLSFSLGWFHYHEWDKHWSSTLMACSRCGVRHSIHHAAPEELRKERREEQSEKDRILSRGPVRDELWSALRPTFSQTESGEGWEGIGRSEAVEWITPWTLEQLPHQVNGIEMTPDTLAELMCHYCESEGTLVKDWPKSGAPCPNCGEVIKDARSIWVT